MSVAPPVVAAFDFDGTLTTRDCVVPFLEQVAGRGSLARRIARHPAALVRAGWLRDRDLVKAIAVRAGLAGRAVAEVESLGLRFAQRIQDSWLRPDTARRLAWHQRQGHRVVVVSASLGAYLRPLAERLGVADVLCTEAVVDADGRYTGELLGANCRGPEKVRRLRDWLAREQLDDAELWAYGDSRGDLELLAAAHRQHNVKGLELSPEP